MLPLIASVVLVLAILVVPEAAHGVPANPIVEPLSQPDGTVIWARQLGDEWANGHRTDDGYTILQDEASGFWVYAEPAVGGGLQASPWVVGHDRPLGIPKHLPLPTGAGVRTQRASESAAAPQDAANTVEQPAANLGSQRLLVIFADFTPSARAGATPSSLSSKFFGSAASVKDYYEEVSYGNFTLTPAPESNTSLGGSTNDGIVSVVLPYAHPDTASSVDDRNRTIVRDALIAADAFVDFSPFDSNGDGFISPTELHIIVVVAGYERSYSVTPCGPSVWGHRWGLYGTVPAPVLDGKIVGANYAQFGEWHCAASSPPGHQATIGIMVHEFGHDIGLPDLYDTDGSSEGTGQWGVMGSGSWNGVSLAGDSPAHMDPWSKFFEGWISPTLVTGTLTNEPIQQAAAAADVYQLLPGTAGSGEYFLVENRQRTSYDAGLPGSGLLIWHIDASKSGNTDECYPGGPSCATSHYKVAVVQADNLYDLEKGNDRGDTGDPWPGLMGKTTFNGASSPNANLYSGIFSGVSVTNISSSGATMTATLQVATNAPIATTTAATSVTATSATLNGTVNPNGLATTVSFQWGTTTAYGNSTASQSIGSGTSAVGVTAPLSGLTSGTTYHFRVAATNSAGTTLGGDMTFTPAAPASLSASPTSVAPGGSVTVTWSGIAGPSATDWIGLYSPGSGNTGFLAWIYVSCSRTATTAKASGSCPFSLPNPLASGTYEFRLFANNGYTRLATSNTISVTATNTAPAVPTTLGQFRTDAVTAIVLGATTPETSVVLKGALSDSDAGQTIKLQLEVRPLGTAFSNAATHESALLASGSLAAVTVPSLAPGTSYHWQARAVDNQGAASAWTPFGANAETAADFAVASSSATLSVSPTSAAPGGSVTATWSGIASPSPTDWIGLYSPGGADTAFLSWIYVGCSRSATTAKASGFCPVALPNPLASGTYEFRLFANNGYTRLATSNAFSVTATNMAPATPTTLGQFRTDAVTAIALGATTSETSVVLKGTVSDPDAGQTVKLQIEVRALGIAFSNTATHESALLASSSLAAVSVSSLAPGTSYHWQARAVDNQGAASAWTPFGANAESAADFAVGSSSTTLSVSPTSAAPGTTVTATWSGIVNPMPMDWLGLYASGSADTAFLTWTYLSCSKATTAVKASGSCPFALPNSLASGTYELRLFANNGFSRLATSGPVTVP